MGKTGREPFSYYDSDIGWKVIFCGNPLGFAFDTEEAAIKYVEDKNESANAWASASIKQAVNAKLEEAAAKIGIDAEKRKCLAYGDDDRYCSYCEAYDDAVDISQQAIRKLKED